MSSDESTSPAFQQLTKDNHGPAVIVASYLFIVLAIVVVITRLITRYSVTRKFAADDYLIIAATVVSLGQTIALTFAVNRGLGRHQDALSSAQFDEFTKAFYAARLLAIPALTLAKASVNLLIIGIQPPKFLRQICYGFLAFTNAWAVAAIFAIAFECDLPHPWSYQNQCVDQWALYLSNGIWNILTDIVLVLLPVWLMWNVQVTETKRWVVIGLFACRIIVPAFSIAGIVAMHSFYNATPRDPTWHAVGSTIWVQSVISLSIITACIPCIKRFLADLSAGMIVVNVSEHAEFTMKNLSSSREKTQPGEGNEMSGGLFGSRLFSRRSQNRSNLDSQRTMNDEEKNNGKSPEFRPTRTHNKSLVERSESMKGLTDGVIVQTIDYQVNYETSRNSTFYDESSTSASATKLSPTASADPSVHSNSRA